MDKNTKEQVPIEQAETDDLREYTPQMAFNVHYTNYLNSDVKNKDYNSLLRAYNLFPNNFIIMCTIYSSAVHSYFN